MRLIYVTIILLIFSSFIYASKERVNGYFITNANDTVKCVFYIPYDKFYKRPKFQKMHWKIKGINTESEKLKIKANQIKEFNFTLDSMDYKFLSIMNEPKVLKSIIFNDTKIFCRTLSEGSIQLFDFWTRVNTINFYSFLPGHFFDFTNFSSIERNFCVRKSSAQLITISRVSFKNDIKKIVYDNKLLIDKIEKLDYSADNILQIINEYNYNINKTP